jgi:hypothetical protein
MIMHAICRRLGLSRFSGSTDAAVADVVPGTGGLHVTEGIGGQWHYHLSRPRVNGTGLCGARTMYTAVPLSTWGLRGHLNETYCDKCAQAGAAALVAT